jgi:sugar lactone lactonase YvrE
MDVRCVVESRNVLGESPLWHPEDASVYWTDINGFRIHRYEVHGGALSAWQFDQPVCSLSLTTDPERLLVAVGPSVILWTPARDERVEFARIEPDWPNNRLNDGATDPNGFYWVGSMRNNIAPDGSPIDVTGETGSLYRVAPTGEVTVWDSGFGITNTLVWSPDRKTFYCACSVRNIIYAYDYDVAASSLRNRRPFVSNATRGVPDGSAIDAEGYIWNCRFFGGCILRFSPSGELDRTIEMPATNITHCAFGGPDLRTLYVTSASIAAPDGERLAGALFAIPMDVAGLPANRFRHAPHK